MRIFTFWILCLFLLAHGRVYSQSIDFEYLSVADGLSQNTVRCILQDEQGFIWLGTEYGLNRYDGYSFTVYRNALGDSTTLADNQITALHEDVRGGIWVGTASGGLHRFNKEQNSFVRYQHNPKNPNSISGNRITSIESTSTGVLWIGTKASGLNRFDVENQIFIQIKHIPSNLRSLGNNQIHTIKKAGDGRLWVGHAEGFDLLNTRTSNFKRYPLSFMDGGVKAIEQQDGETVWVGGFSGLWSYELDSDNSKKLLEDMSITAIHTTAEGQNWVASSQGLWKKEPSEREFIQYVHSPADRSSLSSSNIKCLLEDRSGIIWIGTYGGGVNKYLPSKQRFGHFKHIEGDPTSLSHNYVTALLSQENGLLWVGTAYGLDLFNEKRERIAHYSSQDESKQQGLSNPYVTCLHSSRSGKILIGTREGLNILDPDIGKITRWSIQYNREPLSNEHIYSLYEDELGQIWVGTGNGLNKLDLDKGTVQQYMSEPDNPIGLGGSIITALEPSRNGWLWVGTYDGGFYKFNPDTEIFKGYWRGKQNSSELNALGHSVLSILETSENDLWVSTFESGFHHFFVEEERFVRYSVAEGMPNNQVYGILQDEAGDFWCSSSDRLVKFDPEAESFRSYNLKDGLQGNEFSENAYDKGADGMLYFGGPNGFNAFYPYQIRDNKFTPNVVLTGFELSNEKVSVSEEGPLNTSITELQVLELEYWQHSFAFEFAALSYQLPEKNQYAYLMEGIDQSWQNIGYRRKVYFTDINPGVYTFKVKATNSDGVWNQQATEVKVIVHPPFWKTWWFALSLLLTLALATFWAYRQFQQQVSKKISRMYSALERNRSSSQEQRKLLEERTEALRHTRVELDQHKDLLLEKDQELRKYRRDIQENMEYAAKVQQSQLVPQEDLKAKIPNSFLIYQPKMIVGGDFYWASEIADEEENQHEGKSAALVIAIGECAGRSISGALLSMVGMQLLDGIVNQNKLRSSKKIVDTLSKRFSQALNYNQQGNAFFGMDLALCTIDFKKRQIEFVGAMRPLIYIVDKELFVIQGNGFPIGMAEIEGMGHGFTRHFVPFNKPTTFYLLTDGFEDQLGGREHRKFHFRRLKELLLSIHELPMDTQKERLEQEFAEWRGEEVQIDDLCILGFRLPFYS